jgi:tellurite resistance protein
VNPGAERGTRKNVTSKVGTQQGEAIADGDETREGVDPGVARQRRELRGRVDGAAERLAARRALASAVGTTDEDLLDRIEQLGFTGDSVGVLGLLPLIHVAWSDGRVHAKERAAILEILDRRGVSPESGARLLVETLLESRPSETYVAETLALIVDLGRRDGTDPADLVDLCARVAEASGGLFGFGVGTSKEEEAATRAVAEALGPRAMDRFKVRFGGSK